MTDDPKNENNQDPYVAEVEDEELGGDSEEVRDDNEFHRPEQDKDTVSKDVGLPSPSTR